MASLPHTLIVPDGKGGQITITDPEIIADAHRAMRAIYAPAWQSITAKDPPDDHANRILVVVDGRVEIARRWYSSVVGSHFTPDEADVAFWSQPTHWMPLPEPPKS